MAFINIHTHSQTIPTTGVIAIRSYLQTEWDSMDCQTLFSVGLHPCYPLQHDGLLHLNDWASHPNCFLIGECGLDKFSSVPISVQQEFFIAQIQLAQRLYKPMVIHCVRAFNELLLLKKQYAPKDKWLIHGFNKHPLVAQQLVAQGCFISFGSAIFRQINAIAALQTIPSRYIFLETDTDNILIDEVYERAAALLQISVLELQQLITENYMNLIG
ncbi:MAG: TatD family hydrolase [Saprospiraceae bacterium]|nr:TatD family hydrolase [Saprospiraceae bacterium]MBP7679766.1 TatD family hydrolase [Saprospiraceae bacterium]